MRSLRWLIQNILAGTTTTLIVSIVLLLIALAALSMFILPYFNEPRTLSNADLRNLGTYSSLERVIINADALYDGNRRAKLDDELVNYGIMEVGSRLLLFANPDDIDTSMTKYVGTLIARRPHHITIFDDLTDDLNLSGTSVGALFRVGEPQQSQVMLYFIIDGVLFVLGIVGVFRYAQRRFSRA